MEEELSQLNDDEQLKAENDFLKMKLMLEHGGHFYGNENTDTTLPPDIENQFLNNILAFEKQFEDRKIIKVFDKIGRPRQFRPAAEIAHADIEKAWQELKNYLNEHGVDLDAVSSNITARELYRFAIEELFEYETDDIDLPGWTSNFIYDEFHPDHVYDNSKLIEEDLLGDIFSNSDLFSEMHYASDGFIFNTTEYPDFKTFGDKINTFKSLFDQIEMKECEITNCRVGETESYVDGRYRAVGKTEIYESLFTGDFRVKLITSDLGYWYMKEIQIEGFNP